MLSGGAAPTGRRSFPALKKLERRPQIRFPRFPNSHLLVSPWPISKVSADSKRVVLVGWAEYGAEENGEWEDGHNGQPRNPEEPHGFLRSPTEPQRNTCKKELRPPNPAFYWRFHTLALLAPLPQYLKFR